MLTVSVRIKARYMKCEMIMRFSAALFFFFYLSYNLLYCICSTGGVIISGLC